MASSSREVVYFHAVFFALCAPVLLLTHGPMLGQGLSWLAAGYQVALLSYALLRGHGEWLWAWLFLAPVSIGQVFPDWALSEIANTLVLPDLGQPRIGGVVPVYFAGLWMTLLFPIVMLSTAARRPLLYAALFSLIAFAFCEWAARPVGVWYNRDVQAWNGMAYYPLIPEMLLGMGATWAYRNLRNRGVVERLAAGLSLNVFYTGACFLALLVFR